jgi:hypothetical protein
MVEKRAKRRQKTLLHGFVYFDDGPCAVECVVREISEAGARLKFEMPLAPVEAFELDIPLRGQKLRAEVKWQRGNEMGVVFTEAAEAALAPTQAAPASTEELGLRVLRLESEIAALQRLVKRLQKKIVEKIEAA